MAVGEDKPVKLIRKRLAAHEVEPHLQTLGDVAELEIRVKGAARQRSDATGDSLAEVGRRLLAGDLAAVQIRYCRGGQWWIETVMRAGDDFRLVRMPEGG